MKKVIISFLLLLTTVLSARAEEEWTEVRSAKEFCKAVCYNGKRKIKLKADIDFTDVTNADVYGSSSIDGICITGLKDEDDDTSQKPYFSIKNMLWGSDLSDATIDHLVIENTTRHLFTALYNCKVDEIIFQNCNINQYYRAFLCENAYNSEISHVTFYSCNLYQGPQRGPNTHEVGMIAAFAKGTSIHDCLVTASCHIYNEEEGVGGIVGIIINCNISNCEVYATILGNANYCGGIVGYSDKMLYTAPTYSTISNCVFGGLVKQEKFEDYEEWENWLTTRINNTVNEGFGLNLNTISTMISYGLTGYGGYKLKANLKAFIVTASSYEASMEVFDMFITGGAATVSMVKGMYKFDPYAVTKGFVNAILLICRCTPLLSGISFVDTLVSFVSTSFELIGTLSGNDQVGGIIGKGFYVNISGCTNYGMVYCEDSYCGGIVGYGDHAQISNCLNHGVVHAGENTGGIAGKLDEGGSIKYCMNLGNVACTDTESAGRICGNNNGSTVQYNCVSDLKSDLASDCTSTETSQARVSQLDIVSGRAALYLNKVSNDTAWHQNIGEDFWPLLCAASHNVVNDDKINTNLSTIVDVDNRDKLFRAMVNPYSDINLTADIDFEGDPVYNLSSEYMPFCGSIEGNNHIISNILYQEVGKAYSLGGMSAWWESSRNVGLLGCVKNARFQNIILKDIRIVNDYNIDNEGLFVGKSSNSVYKNIHIIGNSSISRTGSSTDYVGGLIGYSEYDKVSDCSVGLHCSITPSGNDIGGIIGHAEHTTVRNCWNAAELPGEYNHVVGGIIGSAYYSNVISCMNTGNITGEKSLGGIIGFAEGNCQLEGSVNNSKVVAIIQVTTQPYRDNASAGLVGSIAQGTLTVGNNLFFGELWSDHSYSINIGYVGDTMIPSKVEYSGSNWYYVKEKYCETYSTNINYNSPNGNLLPSAIKSGEFAYYLNEVLKSNNSDRRWYQLIDDDPNNLIVPTEDYHFPMPFECVGSVYQNIQCDGTATYSNLHQSSDSHTAEVDQWGLCTICGQAYAASDCITIHDATDLCHFSDAVRLGAKYSDTEVSLDGDIDMKSVTSYIPIGTSEHPFIGTFDGHGYCIKNLKITREAEVGVGLFGSVSGTTTIMNVGIDSTCVISCNAKAVGGVVGSYNDIDANETQTFTLRNCYNEADIMGNEFVAGVAGAIVGVKASVNISLCYNIGNIYASQHGAAVCGYLSTNGQTTFTRSWNAGNVRGYTDQYSFIYYENPQNPTFNSCYNLDSFNESMPSVTADEVASGHLAFLLNGEYSGKSGDDAWFQEIGVDPHPNFNGRRGQYDKSVYRHYFSYCYDPNVLRILYNNEDKSIDFLHQFDENGFCHAMEGETHYEEPECSDKTWKIKNLGNCYYVNHRMKLNILGIYDGYKVSYERNVQPDTWGTLVVPFPVTSTDRIQFYTCSDLRLGEALLLTKAETIPANVPCFFKTSDKTYSISLRNNAESLERPSDYSVSATYETSSAGTIDVVGSYLQQKTILPSTSSTNYFVAQNQLWWGEEAFKLPPFRAYLTMSQQEGASRPIAINLMEGDGESTQIGEIDADGQTNLFDTPIYNIYGQRQSSLQQSRLNIIGGQKILVR